MLQVIFTSDTDTATELGPFSVLARLSARISIKRELSMSKVLSLLGAQPLLFARFVVDRVYDFSVDVHE